MPKSFPIQNAFNAGEITPLLEGRTDIQKYGNAVKTMAQFRPQVQGGAATVIGGRYVATSDSNPAAGWPARLIPFVKATDDAYVLEFINGTMRVYKNGATVKSNVPGQLGAEVVVNGDFPANINSWTLAGYSYATTWDAAGRMKMVLTYDGAGGVNYWATATQRVNVTTGHSYRVSADIAGDWVSRSVTFKDVVSGVDLAVITVQNSGSPVFFTATGATIDVIVRSNLISPFPFSPVTSYFDNITMKEVLTFQDFSIPTPYVGSQVDDIWYAQSGDVLFLFHQAVPPQRLSRFSDADWSLEVAPFNPSPSSERGLRPNTPISIPSNVGTGIVISSTQPMFVVSDVGRTIYYKGGEAVITSRTNYNGVVCDVVHPFSGAPLSPAAGTWELRGSPVTGLTPSASGPMGATIEMVLDAEGWSYGWRGSDVGKYVRINGGLVLCIEPVVGFELTKMRGQIVRALTSAAKSLGGVWSVDQSDWNGVDGYPAVACFHEQRMFVGGTTAKPTTFWASGTDDYLNFLLGVLDSDPMEFMIASSQADAIRYLVPTRVLLAGTQSGEFRISGGQNPITPTNIQVSSESTYGAASHRPERVGNTVMFLQRARRKIRELVYAIQQDGYSASNINTLAEHLTKDVDIKQIVYQQEPDSVLWSRRADGVLLGMVYDKQQEVYGWYTRTSGDVKSMCVIPGSVGDQLWMAVKRVVNGSARIFIEFVSATDAAATDCSVKVTGVNLASITGLTHLNGATVHVVADGTYRGTAVVANGAVALDPVAQVAEAGLWTPAQLVTCRPEVAMQQGTSQGKLKRWVDAWLRVYETSAIRINGETKTWAAPFTGDVRVKNLGYDRDGRVTVEQVDPRPVNILSLFGTLEVGD